MCINMCINSPHILGWHLNCIGSGEIACKVSKGKTTFDGREMPVTSHHRGDRKSLELKFLPVSRNWENSLSFHWKSQEDDTVRVKTISDKSIHLSIQVRMEIETSITESENKLPLKQWYQFALLLQDTVYQRKIMIQSLEYIHSAHKNY